MKYLLLPFFAWLVCGSLKFVINFLRSKCSFNKAWELIGYGGFPSTHSAILSSAVFFAGFSMGFDSPVFLVGLGTLLIVIMDAHGLRRKVGSQAKAINELRAAIGIQAPPLRERMGHSWLEIFGGLVVGMCLSALVFFCLC